MNAFIPPEYKSFIDPTRYHAVAHAVHLQNKARSNFIARSLESILWSTLNRDADVRELQQRLSTSICENVQVWYLDGNMILMVPFNWHAWGHFYDVNSLNPKLNPNSQVLES